MTAEEFGAVIRADLQSHAAIVKQFNIVPD